MLRRDVRAGESLTIGEDVCLRFERRGAETRVLIDAPRHIKIVHNEKKSVPDSFTNKFSA